MIPRLIRPLILAGVLCLFACGEKEPAVDPNPPAYAKPAYATPDQSSVSSPIRFSDITEAAGIDFVHETGAFGKKWMPETMGSGGGFLDYDNDGHPDLFLVNSSYWRGHEKAATPTQKLYRNIANGRFKDVTNDLGLNITLYGMGYASADYDGDGDTDIYITAVGDNKLLRNDGSRFTDVTVAAGVVGNSDVADAPPAWSTSAAWVDVDHDGWLDLFVCNYVRWTPETDLFTTLDGRTKSYATPEQYQGETCRLYRNLSGEKFRDVTREAGVFNPDGKSLGVAVADFNDDGWIDLVVANDTQPNFLYLNNGDGTFADVGLRAGVAYDEFGRARAGMGIDVADVANNGQLAIAIGNFAREPLSLFTQIQPGVFQDLAGSARLSRPSLLRLTFGVLFSDFDLDGYSDLFVANGHIEPEINRVQQDITFAQSPQLFLNNRNGAFVEITDQMGDAAKEPVVARGLAAADIDDDGDLDLMMTINGGAPKLLRNDLTNEGKNWIKFRLIGKPPNINAIGAVVTVHAGGFHQRKMLRTGSSYLSQSDISALVFGLGSHTRADSIEIRWPTSGRVAKLASMQTGRMYKISE